jgi:AcrR family transcriptional regulator
MSREEVHHNQWLRTVEGMIAAVARNGYYATSVKQVIALAGVSRRSFYELFTSKEDCFAQACQMICDRLAEGVVNAADRRDVTTDIRMREVIAFLVAETEVDADSMQLLLFDAPNIGPGGRAQLDNMLRVLERVIAREFAAPGETAARPSPLVRAVVGGLARSMLVLVRDGSTWREDSLIEGLCRWVMLLERPVAQRLSVMAITRQKQEAMQVAVTAAEQTDQQRLQLAMLELLNRCEYAEAIAPARVADLAGLSIKRYFEIFKDGHDCLLAAYDSVRRDLLTIAARPRIEGSDWATSVILMVRGLMGHLADNPLHARAFTCLMFEPESELVDLSARLFHEFVALMIVGAPGRPDPVLASELIKGAIWHLLSTFVECRKPQILPLVADHVAYLVLALYLGGETAMEVIEGNSSSFER